MNMVRTILAMISSTLKLTDEQSRTVFGELEVFFRVLEKAGGQWVESTSRTHAAIRQALGSPVLKDLIPMLDQCPGLGVGGFVAPNGDIWLSYGQGSRRCSFKLTRTEAYRMKSGSSYWLFRMAFRGQAGMAVLLSKAELMDSPFSRTIRNLGDNPRFLKGHLLKVETFNNMFSLVEVDKDNNPLPSGLNVSHEPNKRDMAAITEMAGTVALFGIRDGAAQSTAMALCQIMGTPASARQLLSQLVEDGHVNPVYSGVNKFMTRIVMAAEVYCREGYLFRFGKYLNGESFLEATTKDGRWGHVISESVEMTGQFMDECNYKEALTSESSLNARSGRYMAWALQADGVDGYGRWTISPRIDRDGVAHLVMPGLNCGLLFRDEVNPEADVPRMQMIVAGIAPLLQLQSMAAGQRFADSAAFAPECGVHKLQLQLMDELYGKRVEHASKDGRVWYTFSSGSLMTKVIGGKGGLLYQLMGQRVEGTFFAKSMSDSTLKPNEIRLGRIFITAMEEEAHRAGRNFRVSTGEPIGLEKHPNMLVGRLSLVEIVEDSYYCFLNPLVQEAIANDNDGDCVFLAYLRYLIGESAHRFPMLGDVLGIPATSAAYNPRFEPGMPVAFVDGTLSEADVELLVGKFRSMKQAKDSMAPAVSAFRVMVGLIDALQNVCGADVLAYLKLHIDEINNRCGVKLSLVQAHSLVQAWGGVVNTSDHIGDAIDEFAISKQTVAKGGMRTGIKQLLALLNAAQGNPVEAFSSFLALERKRFESLSFLLGLVAIHVAMPRGSNGLTVVEAVRHMAVARKLMTSSEVWAQNGDAMLDGLQEGIAFLASNAGTSKPRPKGVGGSFNPDPTDAVAEREARYAAATAPAASPVRSNGEGRECVSAFYAYRLLAAAIGAKVASQVVTVVDDEGVSTVSTVCSLVRPDGSVVAGELPVSYPAASGTRFTDVYLVRNTCAACGTFMVMQKGRVSCACGSNAHEFLSKKLTAGQYLAWRIDENLWNLVPQITSRYAQARDKSGASRGRIVAKFLAGLVSNITVRCEAGDTTMRKAGEGLGTVVCDYTTDVEYAPQVEHIVEAQCRSAAEAMRHLLTHHGLAITGTCNGKPGTVLTRGEGGIPKILRMLVPGAKYCDPARYGYFAWSLLRARKLLEGASKWPVTTDRNVQCITPDAVVGIVGYMDIPENHLDAIAWTRSKAASVRFIGTERFNVPKGRLVHVGEGQVFTGDLELAVGVSYRPSEYGNPEHTVRVLGLVNEDGLALTNVTIIIETLRSGLDGVKLLSHANKGMSNIVDRAFSTILMGQRVPLDVVMSASRMCGVWAGGIFVENTKMKTGTALLSAVLSQVAFYAAACCGAELPVQFSTDVTFEAALDELERVIREYIDMDGVYEDDKIQQTNVLLDKITIIDAARESGDVNALISAQYRLAFLPIYEEMEDGEVLVKEEVLVAWEPFVVQPLDIQRDTTRPKGCMDTRLVKLNRMECPMLNMPPKTSKSGAGFRYEYLHNQLLGICPELDEKMFSFSNIAARDGSRVLLIEMLLRCIEGHDVLVADAMTEYPEWIAQGPAVSESEEAMMAASQQVEDDLYDNYIPESSGDDQED